MKVDSFRDIMSIHSVYLVKIDKSYFGYPVKKTLTPYILTKKVDNGNILTRSTLSISSESRQ